MFKRTLVLALMALSLSGAASARVRRGRPRENKIFAANHDSVRLEVQGIPRNRVQLPASQ